MTPRPSGIPGFGRGLFVLLLAALPASLCRAEAARSTDPFADLDAINITIEIGGPLDLQGSAAPELFVGDLARLNRFRSTLERSVGTKLESCGVLWDQGAVDEVAIFVFGRLEQQPAGPALYVYKVDVEVVNSNLGAERATVPEPLPLRSVIGLAAEDRLEGAIIEAAIAIIADDLGACD